jgi:hypothetical protein
LVTGLLLLAALVMQDTTGLSPRAEAMLSRFPPPATAGAVTVSVAFSTDVAWVGEQVELVTAAWFPRELRDRLRRTPTLRAPSIKGLWSVQSQTLPMLVDTRRVRGEVYDLFVMHQTLFPLGPGRIESPPAFLTYSVPTSASYFAPEERQSLTSRTAVLDVRPVPAALATLLAGGPTARRMRMVWRGPPEGLRAGTPAQVELVAEGVGNVTLWPTPDIRWPTGLRIYPERTEERSTLTAGLRGGEKRFRYTVIADSEGVVTLPLVRYPTFDPEGATVRVVTAAPFAMPVFPSAGRTGDRRPLAVRGQDEIPIATRIVRSLPGQLILGTLPLLALAAGVRQRRRRPAPERRTAAAGDPEQELRVLLGTPLDAGSERIVAALRRRGVPRTAAEEVRRWLSANGRRRYGPVGGPAPALPAAVDQVLAHLRRTLGILLVAGLMASGLHAQHADAVARYRAQDFEGAARQFAERAEAEPRAAGAWRDLGSAKWQSGDDVGAVAAWWRALSLAPRDPLTRRAWREVSTLPLPLQQLAPTIPISRDEFLLLGLALVLVTVGVPSRRRMRGRRVLLCLGVASLVMAGVRWHRETRPDALLREAGPLRVSPHPDAPPMGSTGAWSLLRVERQVPGWYLVSTRDGGRGWLPVEAVAPLAALD